MSNEEDRASRLTQKQGWGGSNPLDRYDTEDGFLIVHIGVSTTYTYEPDGEKALEAVADKKDKYLVPCVKVGRKGKR